MTQKTIFIFSKNRKYFIFCVKLILFKTWYESHKNNWDAKDYCSVEKKLKGKDTCFQNSGLTVNQLKSIATNIGKFKFLLKNFCSVLCLSERRWHIFRSIPGKIKLKKTVKGNDTGTVFLFFFKDCLLRMLFCMRSSRVHNLERLRPFSYGIVNCSYFSQ